MPSELHALTFDAADPSALARFWGDVLERDVSSDGTVLLAADPREIPIRFRPSGRAKTGANRFHFDLTSRSLDDQGAIVDRALSAGGRHHDVGQLPDEPHVVLADPEGNEFCVIEPGNAFLANTGAIGALAGDGTAEVGRFWSAALGWPLVWDQDDETAIQSPLGGTKITWGGPPVAPKTERMRIGFELRALDAGPERVAAEADRLLVLGADDLGTEPVFGRVLLDPDGNEFSLI